MDAAVVDLGQVRGLALVRAKGARIRHIAGDAYFIPSTSGDGGYVVDPVKATCSCPANEDTGAFCKHLWALRYHRGELATDVETDVPVEEVTKRPTYAQRWSAYNKAQTEEKERVQYLLRELCDGIAEPKRQGRGRPRLPLADVVYSATMTVYGMLSGRRSATDLRTYRDDGFITCAPAYNSVFRYVEKLELTPLLKELVDESAKPLAVVEKAFAVDSTGFSTQTYSRWFDHRYGGDRRGRVWIKAHAMVGTLTNVVTAVEVTTGNVNDSPMFIPLVERTVANGFHIEEVSGDKAYLSHANVDAVDRLGARPFIPMKYNVTNEGSPAWRALYDWCSLYRDAFSRRYHKRSNVESTFSAIKRKFGAGVRSKRVEAQFNEVLLKCLCHNLSMLVHAIHELNIDPQLWQVKP